jgi:hypothetical protein
MEIIMAVTEKRKIAEAEFHDKLRDPSWRDNPELRPLFKPGGTLRAAVSILQESKKPS